MTTTPTLDDLRNACQHATAIRRVARMQPAGGVGDKVFPPTYEGGEYADEERVIDGARVPCVLLDSVQSQANRMEACLLEAHCAKEIAIPVITVDFAAVDLAEVGTITSLDAPHRLADAILRDSTLDGKKFRDSEPGKVLDTASNANATGLFGVCPTALVFGVWDSAGPRGGLGVKFARALVGEIVGVDAEKGKRPSSRIDPLGIRADAGPAYEAQDGWTLDESKARRDKGKPVLVGKDGKPSELNHGNVTPSLRNEKKQLHHGGVTFRYARHSAVLSLAALRRLHFPVDGAPGDAKARDLAARTVLAALGLTAIALAAERGADLRSRCTLALEAGTAAPFEVVRGDGTVSAFTLSAADAERLLGEAVATARALGLPWHAEGYTAVPRPEFAELVRRSRKLAMKSGAEE